jgi:CO/xanthine dehydrogenase FAD-binding subunit
VLNGLPDEVPAEVIDLQALGLANIGSDGAAVSIGAMATLQDVVDDDTIPPLLRDLAYREAPNTIRNAATIGGTVAAADPESQLIAGLLAHGATVAITGVAGTDEVALSDLLANRGTLAGRLITAVGVTVGASGASARAGRTPSDIPIVMVAGFRDGDEVRLAATGVAATPALIDLGHLDDLDPPADFRGSAAYRRHLAETLGARVLAALSEDATG